jgi:hypothetical protein
MNSGLPLSESFSPWVITLVTLSLLWIEWRVWQRLANRQRLRWGLVAGLNVAAFFIIALLLSGHRATRPTESATLHTDGMIKPKADFSYGSVYSLPAETEPPSGQGQAIIAPGQLALREPKLKRLIVTGHGLSKSDWQQLPDELEISFTPPADTRIVAPQWPRVLTLGETLVVTGSLVTEESRGNLQLELLDPAGAVVDRLSASSGVDFSLRAIPRSTGPLLYRLRLTNGETPLSDEPVGVDIRSGDPLQLLLLQSAPSFELRQLANWAGDRGNPVVSLIRLSSGRTLSRGMNLDPDFSMQMSPGLLAVTDLTVLDGRAWVELAERERDWLLQAVDEGMGLLLLTDAAFVEAQQQATLGWPTALRLSEWPANPASAEAMIRPLWPGGISERPLPQPAWRLSRGDHHALSWTNSGQPLDAWVASGQGRLGLSTLEGRYRWVTTGDTASWSGYWAQLISMLARANPDARLVAPDHRELYSVDSRQLLCTHAETVMEMSWQSPAHPEAVSLGQPVNSNLYGQVQCAAHWAEHAGWQLLELRETDSDRLIDQQWRYILQPDEWQAARSWLRARATVARAGASIGQASPSRSDTGVSPLTLWLLLLVTLGLLWLERQLDEQASPQRSG